MNALRSSVNLRRAGQAIVDSCLIALAYYLAYVLRFDSGIPARYDFSTAALVISISYQRWAERCCSAWNSPISLPNCFLCLR